MRIHYVFPLLIILFRDVLYVLTFVDDHAEAGKEVEEAVESRGVQQNLEKHRGKLRP